MSSTVGSCDCGRRWRGGAEAHCVACHSHFSSDRAFDKHLTDEGCEDPDEMLRDDGKPIFIAVHRKTGITWMLAKYAHAPRDMRQRVARTRTGAGHSPDRARAAKAVPAHRRTSNKITTRVTQ